jgi:hypothetical protein
MRVAQLDASRLDAEYSTILTEQVNDALASAPADFRRAVSVRTTVPEAQALKR